MKKITQFFDRLNNKDKSKELRVSQTSNPEEDDAQRTLNDVNDDEILNITEVLERTNLSSEENLPEVNLEQKRDEEKKYHDKPIQPIIEFPQNKQKRRFQEKWYNEFSWLEYDVSSDSAFCFIGKQYPIKEKEKSTFKTEGFRDWHNAKKLFTIHDTSDSHKTNKLLLLNRMNVEKSKKSVAALVNSQHSNEVMANRKYLKHIIEIIHFLARQGLAYRGHSEDKNASNNLGNFLELFEFHRQHIPYLNENFTNKIAKYTSPIIQNEIIHLISNQIVKTNIPAKYYAIICDETMDLSRKEMLALCFRQVDDSLKIHEKFFGFYRAKMQTADNIFNLIKDALEVEFKLDLQLMVAQSFDGAATMSGNKKGVAKRFKDIIPHSVFVHCYAHKLNLALQDATNQLKYVSDILLIVQNISVFVERSVKRHTLFEQLQGDEKKRTLQNFCATRWSSRYLALKAFVQLFKYLITFLEIVDDDNDKAVGASARRFLKQVKSFDFVFYCHILLQLFEKTHILSKFLQTPNTNIVKALDLCDSTLMDLKQMKETSFHKIFSECKSTCEKEEIEVPVIDSVNNHIKNAKKRKQSDSIDVNSINKYKEKYENIVDIYIHEINKRFPKDELSPIISMYKLLMLNEIEEHSKFDYYALIVYDKFINIQRLRHEITNFINYKINFYAVDWADMNIVIEHFDSNGLKLIYEEIFKLIKIYLTVPITSAQAEIAFSVLKILKTWLRTTMEDERVSDLAIIKMACDVNVDYELIIEEFVKIKERRLKLI